MVRFDAHQGRRAFAKLFGPLGGEVRKDVLALLKVVEDVGRGQHSGRGASLLEGQSIPGSRFAVRGSRLAVGGWRLAVTTKRNLVRLIIGRAIASRRGLANMGMLMVALALNG